MHLPASVFLLSMIDVFMDITLQRPIAAGRVGIQPTACVDGKVSGLLHRLHGKIPGRLDDDKPLPVHPGDNRRSVFSVMSPAGLAFLRRPHDWRPNAFFPPCLACPVWPAVWQRSSASTVPPKWRCSSYDKATLRSHQHQRELVRIWIPNSRAM